MLNEPRRISRKNKTKTSASKRLGSLSCVFAIRNAAPFHFLSRSRRRAAGTDCSLAAPSGVAQRLAMTPPGVRTL